MQFEIEKIIRQQRKTISIHVLPNCKLLIKIPKSVTLDEVKQVVIKHQNWIEKRISVIRNRKKSEKEFVDNEEFLLLGNPVFLKNSPSARIPILVGNKILVNCSSKILCKKQLELWYKKYALDFFYKRLMAYSKLMGVKFNNVRLSNARRLWGSCSNLGNISLSWRLIMAPVDVIDYVVVHELAHLIEHNHSQKFWKQVQNIIPDFKNRKKWLTDFGYLLNI